MPIFKNKSGLDTVHNILILMLLRSRQLVSQVLERELYACVNTCVSYLAGFRIKVKGILRLRMSKARFLRKLRCTIPLTTYKQVKCNYKVSYTACAVLSIYMQCYPILYTQLLI